MSNTVYNAPRSARINVDFTRALPEPLRNDEHMLALGRVIAGELQENIKLARFAVLYARIDELEEDMLDILARDFHVDWYEDSYPVEAKREVIKNSVKVHKRLGTKYAVETALSNIFPGTTVLEWFEYGGQQYTFRINIDVSKSGINLIEQETVLYNILYYKNLRSQLDYITYKLKTQSNLYASGYSKSKCDITVYPLND